MTGSALPQVSVVMLAYGAEPWLEDAVLSVLASDGVDVELVLVDNGCTSDGVEKVRGHRGVRVLTPKENTGYAGGCVLGARESTGEWLGFVNSDAIIAPDALAKLVAVAAEPGVGIAMGSIRLAQNPDRMNSAGNPLHYLGLVWAGGYDEPAAAYADRRSVACASGAGFVMRRALWESLDGFAPEYFAYHEDTELSVRCWQRGLSVEFVPDAVVLHHYEFSRNALKLYLVERNRLLLLATTYETKTLLLIAPMIAALECAMVVSAASGGWLRQKASGWVWLVKHRRFVGSRRRRLQAERTVPDRDLVDIITARFDAANIDAPPGVAVFNAVAGAYWSAVRRVIGASPRR